MKRSVACALHAAVEKTKQICIAVLLCLASVSLSCNTVDHGEEQPTCGPGLIIPGKCVDGVNLGDTVDRVEQVLGIPSNITWTDGLYRAWRSYQYKPEGSEGSGFLIRFIYRGEDKPWGPVDAFNIFRSYEGKTPEGIAIGSTLEEVRNAYGEPHDIPSDIIVEGIHRLQYTYCIDSIKFTIGMNDGFVIGFFIGFFKPIERDQTFQCMNHRNLERPYIMIIS